MNAYLGRVPRANDSGGKSRPVHIFRESRKLTRPILTRCVHHVAVVREVRGMSESRRERRRSARQLDVHHGGASIRTDAPTWATCPERKWVSTSGRQMMLPSCPSWPPSLRLLLVRVVQEVSGQRDGGFGHDAIRRKAGCDGPPPMLRVFHIVLFSGSPNTCSVVQPRGTEQFLFDKIGKLF
jgi:hypothetical protein